MTFAPSHPLTTSVRLRARRRALWMRMVWAGNGSTPDQPAVIQHEDVDLLLLDPTEVTQAEAHFYRNEPNLVAIGKDIDVADAALAQDERWCTIITKLALTDAERELFAVAAALSADPQLGRVYGYLHDRAELNHATPWLASALFEGRAIARVERASALLRWGLLRRVPEAAAAPAALTPWAADDAIVNWLLHGENADIPYGARLDNWDTWGELPVLYRGVLSSMLGFADEAKRENLTSVELELAAPAGSGRRTLAGQFAAAKGRSLVSVNESALLRDALEGDIESRTIAAVRAARLRDAMVYWSASRETHPFAAAALRAAGGLWIAGRTSALPDAGRDGTTVRSFELPSLTQADRLTLWNSVSNDEPPTQVREWLLTPAEVVQVRRVAQAGADAIRQACQRPIESANLLIRLPLPFEKGDLVLTPTVEQQLADFEQQVRHRWSVYEEWGMERLCPNGRGIVALFAGPSGTGKTMAAQVLARSLGLDLYRLDPSSVVNKYIGETEKRLKIIFDECDRANFMLLIDECEGMFGQRFSSKDAHDRYANLEIDYLLQRLERFQGVAVLATNRKTDLDSAFMRRIRMVIDFMPPGPEERHNLWRAAFAGNHPSGEPLVDGLDWGFLAEKVSLTGAEIKLAALNAAFLARAKDERIGMPHVITSVRRELAKKGQTLRGLE